MSNTSRARKRPTKAETFLNIASEIADRSTCSRLSVGAIITNWEMTSIVSMGYNGAARGLKNGCARPDDTGNCGCLHAEENALIKAPYGTGPLMMFCTHMPCPNCAQRIINSDIKRVVYGAKYRDDTGAAMLNSVGIVVEGWADAVLKEQPTT